MEFLARYVRKVHSDRYLKKVLSQTPGFSFLDIIGPSDISYINCIIKNSQEIWLEAISTERSNDEGGQGKKKSAKALFTSGEGKKRVFGECLWNNDGQHYYTYGRDKWAEAYDKKNAQYRILRNAWEKWVSEKAHRMVLGNWTRKSIQSVLATREGGGEMGNAQGGDDEEEEEENGVDDQYDTDNEYHPSFSSDRWQSKEGKQPARTTKPVELESSQDEEESDDEEEAEEYDESVGGDNSARNDINETEVATEAAVRMAKGTATRTAGTRTATATRTAVPATAAAVEKETAATGDGKRKRAAGDSASNALQTKNRGARQKL